MAQSISIQDKIPQLSCLLGRWDDFLTWNVIYCLLCSRIILKSAPTICMLSSSQDQLSLVHGAPIREGTRVMVNSDKQTVGVTTST